MKNLLLLSFALLSVNDLCAQVLKERPEVLKFENKDCKKTKTCDLKSFEIKVNKYKVFLDKDDTEEFTQRGNGMVASYQTAPGSLEKYGIGQFIQGCQFIAVKENDVVTKYPTIVREFMGEWSPYFHEGMVVDGYIADPLAWGEDPNEARHAGYYVRDPSNSDYTWRDRYNGKNAPDNKLYIVDHPGVASYSPSTGRSYNISLQFKTCIYKASEVPKNNDYNNINFAKPIHCFDWSSSHVFNYEKNAFETLPTIDPYCFEGLKDRAQSSGN